MLEPYYYTQINEAGCDEAGRGPLAGPVFAAAVILPSDYCNPALNDSKKLSEPQRNALRLQIENDAIAYSVAFCTNEEIDRYNILRCSILAMHRALDGLWGRSGFSADGGSSGRNGLLTSNGTFTGSWFSGSGGFSEREGLSTKPSYIIVDGNKFKTYPCPSIETFLTSKFISDSSKNCGSSGSGDSFVSGESYSSSENSVSSGSFNIPHTCIVKGDGKYMSIAAASILAKTYRDAYMDLLHRAYPMYGWNTNRAYPTAAHYAAIRKHGITPFHRQSFKLFK
jgi:ribonuclease HII